MQGVTAYGAPTCGSIFRPIVGGGVAAQAAIHPGEQGDRRFGRCIHQGQHTQRVLVDLELIEEGLKVEIGQRQINDETVSQPLFHRTQTGPGGTHMENVQRAPGCLQQGAIALAQPDHGPAWMSVSRVFSYTMIGIVHGQNPPAN